MTTPDLDTRNVRLSLDDLTRAKYDRARRYYGALEGSESALESRAGQNGCYVTRDVFGALYSPNLSVAPETDGTPLRRILDWTTAEVGKLPEWQDLARQAAGNIVASTLATEALTGHLASLSWPSATDSDTFTKDNAGRQDSIKIEAKGHKVTLTRTVNGKVTLREWVCQSDTETAKAADEMRSVALKQGYRAGDPEAHEAQLAQLADNLEGDTLAGPMFRGQVAKAIRKALEQTQEAEQALAMCYGLQGTEGASEVPDTEVAKLVEAQRKNKALADFLRHIGRFLDALKSSPVRQRVRGNIMPYDVATTRDFRRLVPSELAMLAHPATRAMQTVRVVSGQALGWQMAEMGSKGRGPMHIALDMSGSMREQETVAKAFAVAAAFSAADNNRPVSFSVFTTTDRQIADSLDTPEKRVKLVNAIMGISAGGGTDFRPLIKNIGNLEAAADVLLISDGDGQIDETITREVFTNRALHYLVLGNEGSVNSTLRKLAEGRTLTASSLLESSVTYFASNATAAR
jgi:hypothetical protein